MSAGWRWGQLGVAALTVGTLALGSLAVGCTDAAVDEASDVADTGSKGDVDAAGGAEVASPDTAADVPEPYEIPPPPDDLFDPEVDSPNPCVPNPCTSAGTNCDGDTLRTWITPGECSFAPEDPTVATCEYLPPTNTNCAEQGKRCEEVSGTCVQCLDDSDCDALEECDLTLHACRTGCTDDAYEDNDTLEAAVAIPPEGTVDALTICSSSPDWFSVTLAEPAALKVNLLTNVVGVPIELVLVAADGSELAAEMEDGVRTVRSGTLPAGTHFIRVSTELAGVTFPYLLQLTYAAGPACLPNPCVPPSTVGCEGNSVVTYATEGTCADVNGVAECTYTPEAALDCGNAICLAGSCSPHRLPLPGELIISEVMAKPAAPLSAAAGQWIELMNVGTETFTLQTVQVWVNDEPVTLDAHYIAPGDVAVIGRSPDSLATGGAVVDLVAALPTLPGGGFTLKVTEGEQLLDSVTLDASFPQSAGHSVALLDGHFDPADNDVGASWCTARAPYGPGGRGSPGSVNGPCERIIADCRVASVDDAGASVSIGGPLLIQRGDPAKLAGLVHIAGLTDLTTGFDAVDPLVQVEFGLGVGNTVNEDWSWETAQPDTLAVGAADDRWVAPLSTTPAGTWAVAYRVSGDAGETWRVCDADGGSFDAPVPLVVKPNACTPGVCPIPLSTCEGNLLRLYDESSVGCTSVLGVAKCSANPSVVKDCSQGGQLCDADTLSCVGCSADEDCQTPFQACVDEVCIATCTDDGREDDDSADTAFVTTPGELQGVLCAQDRDHLGFNLNSGQRLTLTVTPGALGPTFDSLYVEVLNPIGSTALYAQVGAEPATFSVDAQLGQGGLWVVRLGAAGSGQATYTLTTSVITNSCIGDPCPNTASTCLDDTTLAEATLVECTPTAGGRSCSYGPPTTYTCSGYCVDDTCKNTRPPKAGELVITEVHQDDLSWWVELVVKAKNLSATGLVLEKGGVVFGTFNLPVLGVGARIVVSAAPGVPASMVLLAANPGELPSDGPVQLRAGNTVVDTANWSMGLAQTVGLDTTRSGPTDNDAADAFCTQISTYLPGAFGTPGAPNDACPLAGLWCRFQHPEAAEEEPYATLPAYVRVYAAGLTDLSPTTDLDPQARLRVEAGYGPGATSPGSWTSWTTASPTPGWDGASSVPLPEPNNDEYVATLTVPGNAGTFRMAGRVSGDRGVTWTYCDLGNADPSQDGSANGYSAATAASLVVSSACPPGSCSTSKPAICDGADRVVETPTGACVLQGGTPVCTYTTVRTPCTFGCVNAACRVPAVAGAGEVTLTELMVSGGKVLWAELRNNTSGEVSVGGFGLGGITLGQGVWLAANARVVLGAGDADFPLPTLSTAGLTELVLRRPDTTVISTLPLPDGDGHVSLSEEPVGSPLGTRACDGPLTPGAPNGVCPIVVGWCNLQYPTATSYAPGEETVVYGRVWAADITPQSVFVDSYPGLLAEVGYGPAGVAPDATWTWLPASPNPGWNGANAVPFPAPNDDEYMGTITWPNSSSALDFAFRFSGDSGETWLTCDTGNGSMDGYAAESAGHATPGPN